MISSGRIVAAFAKWTNARRALLKPYVEARGVKWSPDLAVKAYSTQLWQLVKTWEMTQEYGLEGRASEASGPTGESRTWLNTIPAATAPAGGPELARDPRFVTNEQRVGNRRALYALLEDILRRKTQKEWVEGLAGLGVPCSPVNTIDQVFADPQVQHLDMAKPVAHPRLGKQRIVGSAINMTGIDDSPRTATADAGSHTEEVLASLGYAPDAIAALRAKHVV